MHLIFVAASNAMLRCTSSHIEPRAQPWIGERCHSVRCHDMYPLEIHCNDLIMTSLLTQWDVASACLPCLTRHMFKHWRNVLKRKKRKKEKIGVLICYCGASAAMKKYNTKHYNNFQGQWETNITEGQILWTNQEPWRHHSNILHQHLDGGVLHQAQTTQIDGNEYKRWMLGSNAKLISEENAKAKGQILETGDKLLDDKTMKRPLEDCSRGKVYLISLEDYLTGDSHHGRFSIWSTFKWLIELMSWWLSIWTTS